MKKAISILLLIIYTSLSVGFSVSKHFCGGSLAEMAFFSSEKKQCACSLMKSKEKSGCCEDEISIVKLETDQNLAKVSSFSFAKTIHLLALPHFGLRFFPLEISLFTFKQSIKETLPPPKIALYLAFRVFRI